MTTASPLEEPAAAVTIARRVSRRLPRARRVDDIETAARNVFTRHGFAAASMAEIAAEAGIAEGTIYKFFDSKRHLFVRVIEAWYDSMLLEFEKNLTGIVGARSKIRFIVWRHIASLKENRDLARLCANEARTAGEYYQSELHDLNRRYTHVFVEACREGIATGELRPDTSIPLLRDLVFGGIDHHISGMLYGRADVDPDQAADLIVATLFNGVGRPSSEPDGIARLDAATARLEALADRIETGGRRR